MIRVFKRLIIFACAFVVFPVVAQETLNYHSPEMGCSWLDIEYETIKLDAVRNDKDDEPPPENVTAEGVKMTLSMLLFLPLILVGEMFDANDPQYDFSRDPDDLTIAAEEKQCTTLLETIQADKDACLYPSWCTEKTP